MLTFEFIIKNNFLVIFIFFCDFNIECFFLQQMTTPSIQNDLSYYRRMISRQSLSIGDNQEFLKLFEENEQINSELASLMSFFYAQPTPMLKVLSDATRKFLADVS